MSNHVTSYLRVHREDHLTHSVPHALSPTDGFWEAFSAATGWRVDSRHPSNDERVRVLPAVEMDLMGDGIRSAPPAVEESNAAALATHAAALGEEIERLHGVVRRQEIELAAHSLAEVGSESAPHVSDRIHRTIRQAIEATGFDSAAIYLLDDETEFLHTRAVFGLPDDRLGGEPRRLRGSRADLEAFVRQVVLIDDVKNTAEQTWQVPEDCAAAICTAILKDDLPIGTLWLFSRRPRRLDPSHAAAGQLASTQITLELSEAVKLRSESRHHASHLAVGDLAEWQFSSLPVGNHLAPGWYVDGMIESPHAWSVGWHHWDVLPDGTLMIALAEAVDTAARGGMIAATARAALAAHSGYRHTPRQILQRIGDTMWQTNSADQLISLLYARMDPETGAGEIAVSGEVSGLIAGTHGYRPLVHHGSPPLGTSVDAECVESTFQLRQEETLLVYGGGVERDGIGQGLLGQTLRTAMRQRQSPLTLIRRSIAEYPNGVERGLLSVTRRSDLI